MLNISSLMPGATLAMLERIVIVKLEAKPVRNWKKVVERTIPQSFVLAWEIVYVGNVFAILWQMPRSIFMVPSANVITLTVNFTMVKCAEGKVSD